MCKNGSRCGTPWRGRQDRLTGQQSYGHWDAIGGLSQDRLLRVAGQKPAHRVENEFETERVRT